MILPEAIAIGIRFSHASRTGRTRGEKLSNTWPNYPTDRNNLGKLRLIPDGASSLEWRESEKRKRRRMWLRPIR